MEQTKISPDNTLTPEIVRVQANITNIDTHTNIRPRRVGSFTMGITLIGFGILLLICLYQDLDHTYILAMIKLTPVILISLGCEILIYNICFKYEKLKFDVFSFFISGALIFIVIYLSALTVYFENYSRYFW